MSEYSGSSVVVILTCMIDAQGLMTQLPGVVVAGIPSITRAVMNRAKDGSLQLFAEGLDLRVSALCRCLCSRDSLPKIVLCNTATSVAAPCSISDTRQCCTVYSYRFAFCGSKWSLQLSVWVSARYWLRQQVVRVGVPAGHCHQAVCFDHTTRWWQGDREMGLVMGALGMSRPSWASRESTVSGRKPTM